MTKGLVLAAACLLFSAVGVAQDAPASEAAADDAARPDVLEVAPEEAPASAAPRVDAPRADASYDLQLNELEDRLNELKEDVLDSKARLRMLWHQLMQEQVGGSRIIVSHVDRLGGLFELERVTYALDGNQIFSATGSELSGRRAQQVYAEPVIAGPHTIVVQAQIRGNDHGMFSYMSGYAFTLTSSHSFTIDDGKTAEIDVRLVDQGGASLELDERLTAEYGEEYYDTVADGVPGEGGDS